LHQVAELKSLLQVFPPSLQLENYPNPTQDWKTFRQSDLKPDLLRNLIYNNRRNPSFTSAEHCAGSKLGSYSFLNDNERFYGLMEAGEEYQHFREMY